MAINTINSLPSSPSIQKIGSQTPGEGLSKKGSIDKAGAFSDIIADSVSKVNSNIKEYEDLSKKLAQGESVNVHELMLKGERADLSLRMMVAMKNKVVEAYQEVMRIGI